MTKPSPIGELCAMIKPAWKERPRRYLTKIGEGWFDVRWTFGLAIARAAWLIWPSYDNLHRMSREITRAERNPRP